MKTKSAVSYYGSDSNRAQDLGRRLDHCNHVTIPFCGGVAILPHLKARAIVAADKHELLINFYRVASGRYGAMQQDRLFEMCNHTLSHPSEMRLAQECLTHDDVLFRAWAFWAVCWLGFKGKGGTEEQGGKPSIRRTAGGGTNASRVRSAADDLREWAEKHFVRCEFEELDFREELEEAADRPECGIYADPPWDGPGDLYLHKFTTQDHIDLRDRLIRFRYSTVVVRYGATDFIRELYSGDHWTIEEFESRDQQNKNKLELCIMNRRADG